MACKTNQISNGVKKIFLVSFLFGSLLLSLVPAETLGQASNEGVITITPNPALINKPVEIKVIISNSIYQFKFIYLAIDGYIKEQYDCNPQGKYASVNQCTAVFTKTFDKAKQYIISGGARDWTFSEQSGFALSPVTLSIISGAPAAGTQTSGVASVPCPPNTPKGLVPCGRSCDVVETTDINEAKPCQFCDFFVMTDRIIDFIVIKLVPIIAALMLAIGGGMFFFAGANPNALKTAKSVITSTIMGIVIIYAAFLIVGTILSGIGLADWTTNIYKNWWQEGIFQIPCQ